MKKILVAYGYGSTWSTTFCVKKEDRIKLILDEDIIDLLNNNENSDKIKSVFKQKYPQYADRIYLFDFEDLTVENIPDDIKFNIIHPDDDGGEVLITSNDLIY